MSQTKRETGDRRRRKWDGMTMSQYVRRRNGIPLGASGSLRNMLVRSFGAGTFAGFWQYWNPIWGYGLGKHIYAPLNRVLPKALALITTFVISGLIHDLVTMALRRSVTFLFTPWFFLCAVGVLAGRAGGIDWSNRVWPVRAAVNLTYLIVCLGLALLTKGLLAIP